MKFAVDAAHREYFKNHLSVEFEDFLTPENVDRLQQEIKSALEIRLQTKNLDKVPQRQLFIAGRDLWRSNAFLYKLLQKFQFAQIAADLMEEKAVRIGYDQYLPIPPTYIEKRPHDDPYIKYLKFNSTLEATSSIEGILVGLLICLKNQTKKESFFPHKIGNVVYFASTAHLDFTQVGGEMFLMVYTKPMALYTLQENDPHAHALKHLGYGYGDLLSDKLNPLIRR